MASRRSLPLPVFVLMAGCPGPAVDVDESADSSSTGPGSTGPSSTGPFPASSSSSSSSSGPAATNTSSGGEEDSTTGSVAPSDPGCPACIVLVDGLVGGRGLALDPSHVYFTDETQGTISSILKDGGDGAVLVEGQDSPYDIAVDDTHVYWTNFANAGAVMRVQKDGGEPEEVASATRPRSVVVGETHVYWGTFEVDDGDVARRDLAMRQPQEQLANVFGGIADLALGGAQLYFTAHADVAGGAFIVDPTEQPVGGVFQVPTDGSANPFDPELLVGNQAQPWGLALTPSGALVWANGDGLRGNAANSIMTLSPGGGAEVLDGTASAPWGVAADASWAYWTDNDRVFAVALAGGAPVLLAEEQNGARSIAADDDGVFWITRERVLQRPLPD